MLTWYAQSSLYECKYAYTYMLLYVNETYFSFFCSITLSVYNCMTIFFQLHYTQNFNGDLHFGIFSHINYLLFGNGTLKYFLEKSNQFRSSPSYCLQMALRYSPYAVSSPYWREKQPQALKIESIDPIVRPAVASWGSREGCNIIPQLKERLHSQHKYKMMFQKREGQSFASKLSFSA